MTNGWTGGQYSLFRALFGALLCVHFVQGIGRTDSSLAALTLLAAALLSLALMVGLYDRAAAVLLAAICVSSVDRNLLIGILLVLHASMPAAPYGAWSARGRDDPGGGWQMPPPLYAVAWVALAIDYIFNGHAVIGLAVVPLALIESLRPWVWCVLLGTQLVHGCDFSLVVLQGLTFDPSWIRPRGPGVTETIFYDGHCGLCHGAVRFVLAEDLRGDVFRFAPLQSDAFHAAVSEAERADLPDSIVVRTADGALLIRSAGVFHIMSRLGGVWRVLADVLQLVPSSVRDRGYDFVARIRHRLFRSPEQTCPLVPAPLRSRFDL